MDKKGVSDATGPEGLELWLDSLNFDDRGLLPVILQEEGSGRVLMLAWADREAVRRTVDEGRAWFWSRSRGEHWLKGATSGNYQEVVSVAYDCDGDTLLLGVRPAGPACHTGKLSCFHQFFPARDIDASARPGPEILREIFAVIMDRKERAPEDSYVARLLSKGEDAVLKKVGEEAAEVLLAAKGSSRAELVWEIGDLWFHTLVLLGAKDMDPSEVFQELARRRK